MNPQHAHLDTLAAALRDDLKACAQHPDVDHVHHVRTGTRRVQALLETILRESVPSRVATRSKDAVHRHAEPVSPATHHAEELAHATAAWDKLLKRIRGAAAPVRDLDVHRQLIQDLFLKPEPSSEADKPATAPEDSPPTPVQRQARILDDWLKNSREHQAISLARTAAKALEKFELRQAEYQAALAQVRARRHSARRAAIVALESFVRLADTMEGLNAANLHDFRKGAKKARYIAESGGEDPQATAIGNTLKRLQDEIGDWHDWLVLADEARTALGEDGSALLAILDAERDRHYTRALRTTTRLRGKLMGEWLAIRRPATTHSSSLASEGTK